ncbi:Cation/H(+) antiporter 6A [Cardamine amara subsp. amara]|uniref:Cation/H(+) antiporter 6A n=1 Tax=Cardamine amara subsp. amara TaxID=228776 RepID=A0ABD1AQ97_CARAN
MNKDLNMNYWNMSWRGYIDYKNASGFCEAHPSIINSHGIWEVSSYKQQGMNFWEYPLPNLMIMIFSTFVIWRLLDFSWKKIGLRVPSFTYTMIAGVILGQTCHLSNKSWLHQIYFPDDNRPKTPETLGAFGFLIYWFLKGVTMDAGMPFRMEKKYGVIGFTTMFVPFVCGTSLFRWRVQKGNTSLLPMEYRLIIFFQSLSAFTSVDILLKDLNIKHSEFGRIALSGAMMTDVLAFVITFSNAIRWERYYGLFQTICFCVFTAFMIFVVRPAMYWMIKQTPEGRPVKDSYIYSILALAFFSFQFFDKVHLFGPTGPFALGLAIPNGYPLGTTLVQKFESFNLGVILPLFGSLSMMQVDFLWLLKECGNIIGMEGQLYEAITFILFLNATKVIASTVAAYTFKMPLRDSFALSLVLSNKSIFELAYFTYAVEVKSIRPEIFTIMATFMLLTSIFIPMALELVHDPTKRFKCYRRRDMIILKDGAELQCLVCVYKPDHITSMTNLLEALNPSKESPMACNILHLIELVGQASPMFISHQLQKPEPGSTSCSDNVINSFRRFHKQFFEYTSLNIFTSISMSEHMHEDINWLALSRGLSLIVLPFHRTWSVDRSTIVSSDDTLRILNLNVLKRAPCSVGIFISRKPIVESHMIGYHSKICLVFNGGKDDREGFAILNRMRQRGKRISLTIIRFVPTFSEMENQEWEKRFQLINLKESVGKINSGSNVNENDENVTYIDKAVSDGSETFKILREMARDYDLFIVGRGSGIGTEVTSGISEWTEFDELGPIGDFLASHEYPSRASVLVVRKQEYIHHSQSQKRIHI